MALTVLAITAWGLTLRALSKKEKDFVGLGAVSEWTALLVVFLSIAALGAGFAAPGPFDWTTVPLLGWLAIVGSTVCYSGFMYLSYKAYQTVEASERAVINQLQIGWILILSVVLLSEHVGWGQVAGVVLVVAGALLCTYEKGHRRWKAQGVRMLALASILAGTASLFDKVGMQYFPPLLYAIPQYGVPTLILMAMLGRSVLSRMNKAWKVQPGLFVAMAVISVLGYVTYLLSLQALPVSQVVPLINLNVILSVLGGILLLDEKKGWAQKILGAVLAFAGAWMIVG